eukprot:TRINITY_DN1667_c0_g3_i1.p1 TRINITY_DN1667_c0_g3~~TRINITY_DN1667_c0_g3_i1.p1  ORF type:complete len:557 (+),score=76.40 TRINITY_DN1667_c0_g3_i1:57-1727(+)
MLIHRPSQDVAACVVLAVAYLALSMLAVTVIMKAMHRFENHGSIAEWSHVMTKSLDLSPLQTTPTELISKVEALVERRQREFSRRAIFLGCPACLLTLVAYIGVKHVDWKFDEGNASLNLAQGHMMLLSLAVAVLAGCLAFKSQPGRCFRIAVHLAAMLRMVVTVLMYQTSEQLLFDRGNVAVARMAVCLAIGGGRNLTIFTNAAFSCCQIASWVSFQLDQEELNLKYGPYCTAWFVMQECLLTLTFCVITAASESRTWEEARMSIQCKADGACEKAVRRLLTTTHDVVMQVDEQLSIQHDASELSDFLKRGPDLSARGHNLMEYLHSEMDREVIEDWMHEARTGETHTICVNLRDSSGSPVSVEVVQSMFLDLDDRIQYLVGIREMELEQIQRFSPLDAAEDFGSTSTTESRTGADHAKSVSPKPMLGTPAKVEATSINKYPDVIPLLSKGRELMYQEFQGTKLATRAVSLVVVLLSWNLPACRVRCCDFHILAKDAMKLLRILAKSECWSPGSLETARKHFTRQCDKCSILIPNASERCYVCEATDGDSCVVQL